MIDLVARAAAVGVALTSPEVMEVASPLVRSRPPAWYVTVFSYVPPVIAIGGVVVALAWGLLPVLYQLIGEVRATVAGVKAGKPARPVRIDLLKRLRNATFVIAGAVLVAVPLGMLSDNVTSTDLRARIAERELAYVDRVLTGFRDAYGVEIDVERLPFFNQEPAPEVLVTWPDGLSAMCEFELASASFSYRLACPGSVVGFADPLAHSRYVATR